MRGIGRQHETHSPGGERHGTAKSGESHNPVQQILNLRDR